jgi:hypothetical protein
VTSLSLETVGYLEPANFWIGPSAVNATTLYYATAASAFPRMRILPREFSDNTYSPPPLQNLSFSFGQLHGQNTSLPALLHSYLYIKVHVFLDPAGLRRRLFVIYKNPRKCILFLVARQVALLGKLLCDVSVYLPPSLSLSSQLFGTKRAPAKSPTSAGERGGGGVREMFITQRNDAGLFCE